MVQQIICKCGYVYAACKESECHDDEAWLKEVRDGLKKGDTVKMAEDENAWGEKRECSCLKILS